MSQACRELVVCDKVVSCNKSVLKFAIPGKKMAAPHFTTIPCEPYIKNKKAIFLSEYLSHPCANDMVYTKFEDVLYLFISVVKVFV